MKSIEELTDQIMSDLNLGDNLYGEIMPIVKGKLLDRHDKLVNKKTRKGETITQDRISNTVHYAVSSMMDADFETVSQTSLYYKLKYDMDV